MLHLYQNTAYMEEVAELWKRVSAIPDLIGKTFLISGATGMIGSLITDVLLWGNRYAGADSRVVALVRSPEKSRERFDGFTERDGLLLIEADLMKPLDMQRFSGMGRIDYIIHAASNTHPAAYASDPIQTLLLNVIGTDSLLKLAAEVKARRVMFLSSVEIYGENRGDTEQFDESYCGYIDCSSLRANYPEGKRAGEALCHAYLQQYGTDFVIVRLARTYGATLRRSDTKAMSQFLWNAIDGRDIVLKSAGTQKFSYLYARDAVEGILWLLAKGECGQAYNLSGKDSDITLRELAQTIAELAGTKVVFDLPDAVESAGFSKATKAMLETGKAARVGFTSSVGLRQGLEQTLRILQES